MAIADRLRALLAPPPSLHKASILPLVGGEQPDRPLEKGFDDSSLLSTFADDAWPYVLANKVGEQASMAPIEIGRVVPGSTGDLEFQPVGPKHPVQQLFDDPNPLMEGSEFIHTLLLYLDIVGHAPIEIVRPGPKTRMSKTRAGFELWLHNPGPWRIVANADATIKGYLWLRSSEADIKWEPAQMTYLRWPNPNDRWYGQGRLQAVRQQIMAEEYAAIRDKKFEKNFGVPPGVLSSEMPLGDPQARELQRRWEEAVGGYNNAGRIAVLGSKTSYQSVTTTHRDAEWLATRRDRVEIMAAAFGIPMPMIRMSESKFANAKEARAELWEGRLLVSLNQIARRITVRVLPLLTNEPLVARFNYDGIEALGENDLEAAQTAKAWADTGSTTVNEIRRRLNLPAADADVGERYIMPVSHAAMSAEDIENMRVVSEPNTTGEPLEQPNASGSRAPRKAKSESGPDTAALDPLADSLARDLESFFIAQRDALHGVVKSQPEDGIVEKVLAVLSALRWTERLRRITEGPVSVSLTMGASSAAVLSGSELSFAVPTSPEAVEYLTTHLNALGVGIQNTTVADVRQVLSRALSEGMTAAQTRQALDALFDGYADWRKDLIARTETMAAYNLGAIKQYERAGIQFVTVLDGIGDNICAEMNGRTITLLEAQEAPLGHPNCRRTWLPVLDGPRTFGKRPEDPTLKALAVMEAMVAQLPSLVPAPVQPPNITIEQAAPIVHVAPQEITLEVPPSPGLTAALEALAESYKELRAQARPTRKVVKRDSSGQITAIVEE